MSELVENISVTVDDAPVATVPLVDNFTADNAAPKASAVGTALAAKVDASAVMEHVAITVDGQISDNQGVILLYGDDIPVDDTNNAPTVKAAIQAVDLKTAADINYSLGVSVKDKIDEVSSAVSTVGAKTANEIVYSGSTTIKGKVDAVEATLGTVQATANSAVLVSAQTLTESEKQQARTNVGAVSSAEAVLVNAQTLTTSQQSQARANIAALGAADVADTVRTSEQTLTDAQKAQARANIGVVADSPASETVALSSGLTAVFTKCGKICTMNITGQVSAAVAQWESLGTIPETYRPYADGATPSITSAGNYLQIRTTGMIQAGYAIAANAYVIANITYITL